MDDSFQSTYLKKSERKKKESHDLFIAVTVLSVYLLKKNNKIRPQKVMDGLTPQKLVI